MYNRILAAIDGSDTSDAALQEAVKLAKDQHAMLRLFHAVDLAALYSSPQETQLGEYQEALQAEGQRVVAEASARVKATGIEVDSKCISTAARTIHDLIEEEVRTWPADLVVIGTNGRKGIRRLILGSVAEGFVRIASKPVLLIRKE